MAKKRILDEDDIQPIGTDVIDAIMEGTYVPEEDTTDNTDSTQN